MRQPDFYSAVYVIIKNEKWEILFWRRKWSFKNWFFQIIPAWHLELWESIIDCWIKEAKEELWIDINEEDLNIIHMCHRVVEEWRVYFDVYLETKKYNWKIKINEIDKCSEIKFIDINNLPDDDFVMYDIEALKQLKEWHFFSENICKI